MYSSREVSELVGLSAAQIRRLAKRGLLAPQRTPRNHYRFSFQDLTFLRTTNELLSSPLPRRRVHKALRELRRQHPPPRPLSELRLVATEDGIVASDTASTWDPESGQVFLEFTVEITGVQSLDEFRSGSTPVEAEGHDADDWFERGHSVEVDHPAEARHAYRQALAMNPTHAGARINLGRLLQGAGQITEAMEHYRIVLAANPGHAVAAYNLGVALEDTDQRQEAFAAYAQAIAADPQCAEAHFNIAKLYEQGGDQLAAVRHLRAYRDLIAQS